MKFFQATGPRARRHKRLSCSLAVLLLTLLRSALAAEDLRASPSAAPPANVSTQPLAYNTVTLKNGLRIITLEDHHAPVVTVEVWYRVGSKDENPGRYGFAHLFEHMMFKGSRNVPGEAYGRYIEELGGISNADTAFDRTRFYETVPIGALARVLFLEADRMASLTIDQPNLDAERHVVEEEYRQDVDNAPYGVLDSVLETLTYPTGHPYGHSPIGRISDLDAATLDEVRAFHDTFYKPDNATLVLVGDFQTADAIAQAEHYFGSIAPRGKPFPRQSVPSPDKPSVRHTTINVPLAPLPHVTIMFLIPPPTNDDRPALQLISTILSGGRNSRMFRSMVGKNFVSLRPTTDITDLAVGGYFQIQGDVVAGHTPLEVENAFSAELDRLRREPVTKTELAKAKNLELTSLVVHSVSTSDVADRLAEADLFYGTAEQVNRSLAGYETVTPADIERVANRYLTPERASIFYAVPPSAPATTTTPPPAPGVSP